jgi:hypothetical protein
MFQLVSELSSGLPVDTDLIVCRQNNMFDFDIFHKPTNTDTIIPFNSCHPREHTLAAVRYQQTRKLPAEPRSKSKGTE